jgi:hypothetical protein
VTSAVISELEHGHCGTRVILRERHDATAVLLPSTLSSFAVGYSSFTVHNQLDPSRWFREVCLLPYLPTHLV